MGFHCFPRCGVTSFNSFGIGEDMKKYYILVESKKQAALLKNSSGIISFNDFETAKQARINAANINYNSCLHKPSKRARYAVITANQAPELFNQDITI